MTVRTVHIGREGRVTGRMDYTKTLNNRSDYRATNMLYREKSSGGYIVKKLPEPISLVACFFYNNLLFF
jgi:hypothetical protein